MLRLLAVSVMVAAFVAPAFVVATPDPDIDVVHFVGFLECSSAPPNGRCTGSFPSGFGNHRQSDEYAPLGQLDGLLLEMVWSASSGIGLNDHGVGGLGGGMTVAASWDTPSGLAGRSTSATGGEPIRMYLERRVDDEGVAQVWCEIGCAGAAPVADFPPPDASDGIWFGGMPNAPNVVLQRRFDIYLSAFYGGTMPDGYTAVPAG